MQGRLENKIKTEERILFKIREYPDYIKNYYYSLNLKTHATKEVYIDNVIRYLSSFNKEETKIEELNKVSSFDIEKYMSTINYYKKDGKIKELSNNTKANIYSSLCSFFTFLSRNNLISNNPFSDKKIERPKIQEGEITYLTPEEVRRVESIILTGAGSKLAKARQLEWKYRDYLLFRIPVVTGLRVTALSEINIEDIDLNNNTISVTEKGNVTKKIYIDNHTKDYIERWIDERADLVDDEDNRALFVSNQKTRMTVKAIQNVIGKYTECIGKKITPHKLRSTCGTNLYQQQKDIYLVSSVLGHKSTSPTKRYTKIDDNSKRDAINDIAKLY